MLWRYSEGRRHKVILHTIFFVIANSILLAEPLLVAKILNTVQTNGVTADNLLSTLGYLLLFVAIAVGFWAFHGPARVIEQRNGYLVARDYKQYLLHGVMRLSSAWHTDHHSGDTIDKVEKGTRALRSFSTSTFEVIEVIVRFGLSFVALVYFNHHSSYVVVLLSAVLVFIVFRFDKVIVAQLKKLNKAENAVAASVYDTLSNITTVIVLRIEKFAERRIVQLIMKPFPLFGRHRVIVEWKWFSVSFIMAIMTFGVLGTYVFTSVRAGDVVLLGTLYVLYGYLEKVMRMSFRFTGLYSDLLAKQADIQNAEELSDAFAHHARKDITPYTEPWDAIHVRDLSFSYDESSTKTHLRNVTFTIPRGTKIALVGESGSGKTTTMKLLRGLYHPTSAQIFADSTELEHGFSQLAERIALVPQDPELFASTIAHNLTMGLHIDSRTIDHFVRIAEFHDVVERLPRKMQSSIVERGVNLSGGEKQRLALARGLLLSRDKEILLLDEPTSSVDVATEHKVFENIFHEFPDTTIIASVHRLHLLPKFDIILMYSDGEIVAQGSYDQLLKESDAFRSLTASAEASP